jgi:myo-inositol-1(or 4)-monophosphatase
MNKRELLDVAKSTAIQAGSKLFDLREKELRILSESGKDTKLEADKISEEFIVDALAQQTGIPLLGEESGVHGSLQDDKLVWVIDPLDGTLNYRRGVPFYCVSIGLWKGNEPILGVIYDLVHEQLYSGIVNEGAWLDELPMCVADTTGKEQAVIATGFPTFREFDDKKLKNFIAQIQEYKKVRLFGAAALSLALCACGAVDAYAEEDIMIWDVAAGIALVKAAGGAVWYESSTRLEWGMNVFCACNQDLIPENE